MATVRYEYNFGSSNAGTPSLVYFRRQDTGAALTAPTLTAAPWGNGSWYFDFDWASTDATVISWMYTLNGAEWAAQGRYGDIRTVAVATVARTTAKVDVPFGTANTGGAPAFVYFRRQDTGAALTQPTVTEAGSGTYQFSFDWSTTDALAVSWMLTLNGIEMWGVLTLTGTPAVAWSPGLGISYGGSQWTREDCIEYVKHLIFEDAASTSIASLANIRTTVDVANRTVWLAAAKASPSLFEKRSADLTYSTATGYYDLTSLESGSGFHLLTRAYIKVDGNYYALEPFDNNERLRIAPEGLSGITPMGFYLEGEYMYLVPKPSNNQTLQLCYVPHLATLTTGTALLGGVRSLAQFHPLVAYEAALTLVIKDEGDAAGIKYLRDQMYKQMMQHLSRRQMRRPHCIIERPFR